MTMTNKIPPFIEYMYVNILYKLVIGIYRISGVIQSDFQFNITIIFHLELQLALTVETDFI